MPADVAVYCGSAAGGAAVYSSSSCVRLGQVLIVIELCVIGLLHCGWVLRCVRYVLCVGMHVRHARFTVSMEHVLSVGVHSSSTCTVCMHVYC